MIAVADSGENQIVVVPGANARVTNDVVQSAACVIQQADVLLLQLEIPLNSALEAIAVARKAGTKVLLDPAPVPNQFTDALVGVDLICPNLTEAATLTGTRISSTGHIEAAARQLHRRGAQAVVITLGQSGAALFDGQEFSIVAPFPTQAIDSTAAGDAFAGAMAVRWAESAPLRDCVVFGNAAGSLSASREGAQPSMALRHEIMNLVQHNQ